MTKLCASSEISFDSANLGFSAKVREKIQLSKIQGHIFDMKDIMVHHTFTGTTPGLVNDDHQRQSTSQKIGQLQPYTHRKTTHSTHRVDLLSHMYLASASFFPSSRLLQ